jgi:branched-chain amino acid transport system permease protein
MIFMVIIGGIGTIEGPILGAVIFYLLERQFAEYGAGYLIGLGVVAVLTVLFAPKGLWGLLSRGPGAAVPGRIPGGGGAR